MIKSATLLPDTGESRRWEVGHPEFPMGLDFATAPVVVDIQESGRCGECARVPTVRILFSDATEMEADRSKFLVHSDSPAR